LKNEIGQFICDNTRRKTPLKQRIPCFAANCPKLGGGAQGHAF